MTTESKKAFVTGGSGFVGQHVIKKLTKAGWSVAGLARSDAAAAQIKRAGGSVVRGNLLDLQSIMAGCRGVSLIVHMAAKTNEWDAPHEFYAANVEGTRNIVYAAQQQPAVRFVHISSEAVLAGNQPIVGATEAAPYPDHFAGPYAWSKHLAERVVKKAAEDGLNAIILRPRLVWGPGDRALLPGLVQAMRSHRWLWYGNCEHLSSSCHINNLCEAVMLACEPAAPTGVFFVTDGPPMPLRHFFEGLVRSQGLRPSRLMLPKLCALPVAIVGESIWRGLQLAGVPPLERLTLNLTFMEVTVDDTKARAELGYKGHTSVQAGLADLHALAASNMNR